MHELGKKVICSERKIHYRNPLTIQISIYLPLCITKYKHVDSQMAHLHLKY